jgi:hypothetical protein
MKGVKVACFVEHEGYVIKFTIEIAAGKSV